MAANDVVLRSVWDIGSRINPYNPKRIYKYNIEEVAVFF